MSGLTRVISTTKKSLIYIGLFFVAFLLFSFVIYSITQYVHNYYLKKQSLLAQNGFGVIPQANFKKISISSKVKPQFILNNTVNINNYPKLLNVYKLQRPQLTLSSLDTVKNLISNMGINNPQESNISPFLYQWSTLHHKIIFNLNDLSFNISLLSSLSSYINYQTSNGYSFNFNQASSAESAVYGFLQGLSYENALGQTVNLMNMNSSYFSAVPVTINNNSIGLSNTTGEIPNAYYVFYRKHINGYKIYGSNPEVTSINFLVDNTSISGLNGIISANFTNYNIGKGSTYNIISPYQAFIKMQSGSGALVSTYQSLNGNPYIVNYNADYKVSKFYVNNISLGYYEPPSYTNYLIPIYVLSGELYLTNNQILNFSYYVNAL